MAFAWRPNRIQFPPPHTTRDKASLVDAGSNLEYRWNFDPPFDKTLSSSVHWMKTAISFAGFG
jgi:hypothetical protein